MDIKKLAITAAAVVLGFVVYNNFIAPALKTPTA